MGNALAFQSIFNNIKIDQENQNYNGVWTEYGNLIYITWDFQKISSSARYMMDYYVAQYMSYEPEFSAES